MQKYVDNIRKLFTDVYGDAADEMMHAFGLEGTDREIAVQWFKVKGSLDGINSSLVDIAKQTADWFDQLESAQLRKGLESTQAALGRIADQFELEEISKEKMIELSNAEIEKALEYLGTLEPTQEVLDAITQLKLQQLKLQKELNEESSAGIDIEDEKLRKLLLQREEMERDIAAGYIREGTSSTVSAQEDILRQIIARYKELGLSRDQYFEYEDALADLISGYAGASYTGLTGYGVTPGVDDVTHLANFGVKPLDPSQVIPQIPITATNYYNERLRASSSPSSDRQSRSSASNVSNQVVFNGQVIQSTQEQFDKIRAYVKQVYGIDIAKGA